ncbi:MAG: hypothetical protein GEV03_18135 [Streptosporangiales bacterium]|nr:hypothetical protein [Streptosporangiales bacterium]
MAGTFGGALEARKIPAGDGRLQTFAVGEIELEGHTLVLKRINVTYQLTVDPNADQSAIERVHGFHAERCPVARSIGGSVAITTHLEVAE